MPAKPIITQEEIPERFRDYIPEDASGPDKVRLMLTLMRFEERNPAQGDPQDTQELYDRLLTVEGKIDQVARMVNGSLDLTNALCDSVKILCAHGPTITPNGHDTDPPPPQNTGPMTPEFEEEMMAYLHSLRVPSEFSDLITRTYEKFHKQWSEPNAAIPGRWQQILGDDLTDRVEKAKRGRVGG